MSDIAHRRRGPWCGLGSLSIALCLLAAIHFLTTAEGQRWVEDFFRPLGYAAILLGIVGPALFLGMSGLVLLLAISAGIRHEPYRLGELALTIVLSLFFQIGSSRADLWSTFPLRLLVAGAIVFGAGSGVRWIWRRFRRPGTDLSEGSG